MFLNLVTLSPQLYVPKLGYPSPQLYVTKFGYPCTQLYCKALICSYTCLPLVPNCMFLNWVTLVSNCMFLNLVTLVPNCTAKLSNEFITTTNPENDQINHETRILRHRSGGHFGKMLIRTLCILVNIK